MNEEKETIEELRQVLIKWRDGFREDMEKLGFKVKYPKLSEQFRIDTKNKIIYYPNELKYTLLKKRK